MKGSERAESHISSCQKTLELSFRSLYINLSQQRVFQTYPLLPSNIPKI